MRTTQEWLVIYLEKLYLLSKEAPSNADGALGPKDPPKA